MSDWAANGVTIPALAKEGGTVPQSSQLQDIDDITELTYDQLRHALQLIPGDKMAFKATPLATTPTQIVIHACNADLHYLNVIDGGSRSGPIRPEDEPAKAALLRLIADAQQIVASVLAGLNDEELSAHRDVRWRTEPKTVRWILLHMLRHKHYHAGQLNYIHFLLGIDER